MGSRFGRHLGIVIRLEKVWQVDLVATHLFQLWSRSALLTSQLYNNHIFLYSRSIMFSCTHTTIATPSHNTYAPTNLDQLWDDTRTTFKCYDIFVNVFSEKLMRNVYSFPHSHRFVQECPHTWHLWGLLFTYTWINLNPIMDKQLHPIIIVGWDYLSISKHQQCSRWNLRMDK